MNRSAIIWTAVAWLLLGGTALADSLEKLLMPGPLIEGHAKFEGECSKCHDLFKKTEQNAKCLDCHRAVMIDLKRKRGFHGKSGAVAGKQCKYCHTDHEGRKMDIVQLDIDSFDHAVTDFALKGRHKAVACARCHSTGKKYRDAPGKCFSCHEKDDPHSKRLGTDCKKCHNETQWKSGRFDHAKTKFPLKGKHNKVSCNSCHPNQRFKNTPMECSTCHKLNDVHAGTFGAKCDTCHKPEGWRRINFDHNRDTKFPLTDRHARLQCGDCHKTRNKGRELKKIFKGQLDRTCWGCHKNDDVHKGRFERKCDKCHTPATWKQVKFRHEKDTKFSLTGTHGKLDCNSCHKENAYKKKLGMECIDCHKADDIHRGEQGKKCDKCHNTDAWGKKVKFDHNKTKFPLTGLHKATTCENCHVTAVFKEVGKECIDCHVRDDVHKKRLGSECKTCHQPEGWAKWKFDHDKQTKFKLEGSHGNLNCHACHTVAVKDKIKMDHDCVSCHRGDDVHRGEQGQKCDKCHNATSWRKKVKFDHDKTRFPLKGLHKGTACENCHVTAAYKDVGRLCVDCHVREDVHKERLGPKCDSCHNPNGWKYWKFDHARQTKFPLKGVHEKTACLKCHTAPVKDRFQMDKTCVTCHRQDDVHKGKQGGDCGKCHNESDWGGKIRFEHDLTRFPLIGIHATTTCEACHLTAAYKETPSRCIDCHQQKDVHTLRLGPTCETCHNPNGWKLWQFDHNRQTDYVLDGKHEGLVCEACHRVPVQDKIELSSRCYGCHVQDDVHRGRFGRWCESCHVTTSFKEVKVRH